MRVYFVRSVHIHLHSSHIHRDHFVCSVRINFVCSEHTFVPVLYFQTVGEIIS